MPDKPISEEAIVNDYPRLAPDDAFTFRCEPDLDCFTRCCQDVSIVLTPYDVLRLRRAVGVDSSEFLRRYTVQPFTRDQKFPAVLLKMDPETRRCPFVTDRGCSVYAHRPWACRMYPLGAAEPRHQTASARPFHFLIRDETCRGHAAGRPISVREWIAAQGLDVYEMMGRPFKELMLHEAWDRDEPLTPEKMEMYFTACYDLDRFRRFVFETRFLSLFELDEARVEALRGDDEDLLDFAMQWLRYCLFGDRTMRVTPAVLEAAREVQAARADGAGPRAAGTRG
jgi:Fe-S-cluster containining protein